MDNIAKNIAAEKGTITFTFEHQVLIPCEKREQAEFFAEDVKNFAFGIGIRHFAESYYDEHSGLATTLVTFQIMRRKDFILEKVAALFSFAATRKLRLCNQTFTPE